MNYIKRTEADGNEIKLYYEDLGKGQPIVFIHGWPLSQEMWEYQVTELVKHGLRCVTYDRRGFGKSSRPLSSYSYDALADDLAAVLDTLKLEDAVLVGFSMGGGEVVRYLSRHGSDRVAKVVLVSSVTPYMLKTEDNPDGVDESVFVSMVEGVRKDRIGFLDGFGKEFFGLGLLNHPVSAPLLQYYLTLEGYASPIATEECIKSFAQTDFRKDVEAINVPALVIHGDADKIVPIEGSGAKSSKMITDCQYVVYQGAPHGLFYTHKDQLNGDLLNFINGDVLIEEIHAPDSVVLPSNYPI